MLFRPRPRFLPTTRLLALFLALALVACQSAPPDPAPNANSDTRPSPAGQSQPDAAANAMPDLSIGAAALPGTLTPDRPQTFTFDGQAGQTVTLRAAGVALADPRIEVRDPAGAVLTSDDDSGGGLDAQATLKLPSSGRFSVAVAGEQPGDFTLSLAEAAVTTEQEGTAESGKVLYREDFDGPAEDWSRDPQFGKEIKLDKGGLLFTISGRGSYNAPADAAGQPTPLLSGSYAIGFDATVEQVTGDVQHCILIVLHFQPDPLSYQIVQYCDPRDDYNVVTLQTYATGRVLNTQQELVRSTAKEANFTDGRTLRVLLEVRPTQYTLFVDGREVYRFAGSGGIGGFGLGVSRNLAARNQVAYTMQTRFDNLEIRQLPEAPLAEAGEVLFRDEFSSNTIGWPQTTKYARRIEGGSYLFDLNVPNNARDFNLLVTPDLKRAPLIEQPHEVSYEVTVEEGGESATVAIAANLSRLDSYGAPLSNLFFAASAEGYWLFVGGPDGMALRRFGLLPKGINIGDGKPHTIAMRVEPGATSLSFVLLVDGQVAGRVGDFTISMDSARPSFEQISGTFGLGLTVSSDATRARARFDNLTVRSLGVGSGSDLPVGTGLGPLSESFKHPAGRLSLRHPAGWRIQPPEPAAERLSRNERVYNLFMSNSADGGTVGANRLALRVFDPALVMEQGRIGDSRRTTVAEALGTFAATTLPEGMQTAQARPLALPGREAAQTVATGGGRELLLIALRNADKTVSIVQAEYAEGQRDDLAPTVLAIAKTVEHAAPKGEPQAITRPLRSFLYSANLFQFDQAVNQMCTNEALLFQLGGMMVSEQLGEGYDLLRDFDTGGATIDDSGRFYEVIKQEGDEALVRVMGSITLKNAKGTTVLPATAYFDRLFDESLLTQPLGAIYQTTFGSEVYRLQRVNGVWLLCSGQVR